MAHHTAVFTPPRQPPTADEAVRAIYGMNAHQLVREILTNKDGKYDRLYQKTKKEEHPHEETKTLLLLRP